jgi:hypothetical protein
MSRSAVAKAILAGLVGSDHALSDFDVRATIAVADIRP